MKKQELTAEDVIQIIKDSDCKCDLCKFKLRILNNVLHLNTTERNWMMNTICELYEFAKRSKVKNN